MNDLNKLLTLDDDVDSTSKDIIGGGGYIKDSGVYLMKVNHAFFEKSKGGAQGVNISLKHSDEEKTEFNTTVYVTSGNAKGNKPYYINKKGNKIPLPSYITVDDMCKIATGKPMKDSTMSVKSVEVYDYDAGKKVKKEVQVLDALTGAILKVGIEKVLVNKYSNGAPIADTAERNEISKVFNTDGKTVSEIITGTPPEFIEKWKTKHDGITADNRTIKDGAATAATSAHALPAASTDDTSGLFGD